MAQGKTRSYKSGKGEKNKRYKDSRDRRSQRKAAQGRVFENSVMVALLEKMKEEKKIFDFIYHEPNSPADREGRDFTVKQILLGEIIERSFGVTISLNSQQESRIKHPAVTPFFFPPETKPETIQKRILSLFKD